jgi:tartrate dehydratase beta subunit/fumarate hydratase class I family protein
LQQMVVWATTLPSLTDSWDRWEAVDPSTNVKLAVMVNPVWNDGVNVVIGAGEQESRKQTESDQAEGCSLPLTCQAAAAIDSSGRDTER